LYHFQKSLLFLKEIFSNAFKKYLVITSDENKLTEIPIIKVNANPLTKLVPIKKRIKATINVVKFPSLIEGQALLIELSIESFKL